MDLQDRCAAVQNVPGFAIKDTIASKLNSHLYKNTFAKARTCSCTIGAYGLTDIILKVNIVLANNKG